MHRPRLSLALHTGAHFGVDFACCAMLYRCALPASASPADAAVLFLLYNILAFGLQPFIGYLCDRKQRLPAATVGCLILAVGLLVADYAPAGVVVCAVGNACFHVGGGIDSLVHARGKLARPGIFISSGALGVALGTLYGKAGLPFWPLIAGLVALAVALEILCPPRPHGALRFDVTNRSLPTVAVLALCTVSILVRAFGGSAVKLSWAQPAELFTLAALCTALGKALGGILADRFGARVVGAGTLALSFAPLWFAGKSPVAGALWLLLWGMVTSLTLCQICERLPNHPGLSFGITTMALLLGSAPLFFLTITPLAATVTAGLLTLISALCQWKVASPVQPNADSKRTNYIQ